MFCILPKIARNCHGCSLGMNKISMISLTASIDESCFFKLLDKLSNLSWHNQYGINVIPKSQRMILNCHLVVELVYLLINLFTIFDIFFSRAFLFTEIPQNIFPIVCGAGCRIWHSRSYQSPSENSRFWLRARPECFCSHRHSGAIPRSE